MPHIQQRRRGWYATIDIPRELRHLYSGKVRLVKSLKTDSKAVAERRAPVLIAAWKADFARVKNEGDDAAFYRALPEGPLKEAAIALEVQNRSSATIQGYDPTPEEIAQAQADAQAAAEDFRKRATGEIVPFTDHLEPFLERQGTKPKTKHQTKMDIERFSKVFPTVQDVTADAVQTWVDGLGQAPATTKRTLSSLRTYWAYLQRRAKVVGRDSQPFSAVELPKPANGPKDKRQAFPPLAVVRLMVAAHRKPTLQGLIRIAMFTGARLEEICSLKVDRCHLSEAIPYIEIVDAKSSAGWRQIPVHPMLLEPLRTLCKDSQDGFVLSGLKADKYGDRSNVIGHQFGALKTKLSYPKALVFHSIRKTVATMLEDAGVSENLAADLLGHDKPRITYGLYSAGSGLKAKAEAIGKLTYVPKEGKAV